MKVSHVEYKRTVTGPEKYTSRSAGVQVQLEAGDSFWRAMNAAKILIADQLGCAVPDCSPAEVADAMSLRDRIVEA
jgi:hypothetical protein